MAQLSKSALTSENNNSFPNNNTGYITPELLRNFNQDMIDSTVNQTQYSADSASFDSRINALDPTGSAASILALNQFTASQETKNTTLGAVTASLQQQLTNIGSQSGSWITESESGSFLITASFDNGTRNLTFTKGDATTFAVNIPDVSGSAGNFVSTASFNSYTASTDSSISQLNASSASQQISIDALNAATASYVTEVESGSFLITASVNLNTITFTKGDNTTFALTVNTGSGGGADISSLNQFTASQEIINTNVSASQSIYETKFATIGGQSGSWGGGGGADLTSLNSFTQSQYVSNSFFATTGSNVFRGTETFEDSAGNWSSLTPFSGGLMLVSRGLPSGSSYFTASAANSLSGPTGSVNLVFKATAFDASTIVSGSGNIFMNPGPNAAGFRRQLTNFNFFNTGTIPSVSASMTFPLNISSNVGPQTITLRGPVSASTWTISSNVGGGSINIGSSATDHAHQYLGSITISGNTLNGVMSVVAKNNLIYGNTSISNNDYKGLTSSRIALSSSAMTFTRNTIAGNNTFVQNNYFSGSVGFGSVTMTDVIMYGDNNTVLFTGSAIVPTNPSYISSQMLGYNLYTHIDASAGKYIGGHGLIGNGLIVSASTTINDTNGMGGVFVGRWNVNDGVRNNSGEEVFVVGTGTSNTNRKNGLLIDSGSNAFFEGNHFISGNTNITDNLIVTGSLTASLQTGYMYVGNAGGLTQAIPTSSLIVETASFATNATDIVVNVKNTTGAQINKGTVVRIIGAVGDNALIGTASWEDDNNSANTLGFVVTDIPNDSFGRVMTQGTLLAVDTDPALGYTAGDLVYLSSSGQYTNVKPPAPYHEVRLGQVLRAQQNNGSIYVLIQNGYELTELHDVDINTGSLANNDLLAYDSASTQWTNKTLNQLGAATTGSNSFIGTETISGSLIITGSARGNVQALTVTSNTASIDFGVANYFTLTLPTSSTTHFTGTNIQPGLSATLVLTTGTGGTGASASFAPAFLQPSGSIYAPTSGSAKKDVLSFVAVDSTNVYVVATKNMI